MKNEKLNKYFTDKGMTAPAVAKRLGISSEAVRKHLNGGGMNKKTINLY